MNDAATRRALHDEARSIDTSRFAELGLTPELIAYVDQRRYPHDVTSGLRQKLLLVLALVVASAALILGSTLLQKQLEQSRTQNLGGVFHYAAPLGLSLLVGVFAILLGMGALHTEFQESRAPLKREYDLLTGIASVTAMPGVNGAVSRRLYRWLFRDLFKYPVVDQLEQIHLIHRRFFSQPALGFGVAFLLCSVRDLSDYTLVTPSAVTTHEYWTTRARQNTWADLEAVNVGCWVSDNGVPSPYYQAQFGDGTVVNLLEDKPQAPDVALAQHVERLVQQRQLPKQPVTFSFGIHKGQPKLHPDCHTAIDNKYPAEIAAALKQLLLPH